MAFCGPSADTGWAQRSRKETVRDGRAGAQGCEDPAWARLQLKPGVRGRAERCLERGAWPSPGRAPRQPAREGSQALAPQSPGSNPSFAASFGQVFPSVNWGLVIPTAQGHCEVD